MDDKIKTMGARFIDEPLVPLIATADTSRMAGGGPGLPDAFVWRSRTIEIAEVRRSWRETGACRHGSGEMYARRHWFEVITTQRETMKIYFDRQSRRGRNEARWWLFTVSDEDPT